MSLATKYYLKGSSEEEANQALINAFGQLEDHPILQGENHFILIVGVIYHPTGKVNIDEQGTFITETYPLEGWHFNIQMIDQELPASLIPFVIPTPSTPTLDFA